MVLVIVYLLFLAFLRRFLLFRVMFCLMFSGFSSRLLVIFGRLELFLFFGRYLFWMVSRF